MKSLNTAGRIRRLLLERADGLTTSEVAEALGLGYKTVRYNLNRVMADAYIDRWTKPPQGRGGNMRAVWCVVPVPEHCPYPAKRQAPARQRVASVWSLAA